MDVYTARFETPNILGMDGNFAPRPNDGPGERLNLDLRFS
jgi:hypothetical protein